MQDIGRFSYRPGRRWAEGGDDHGQTSFSLGGDGGIVWMVAIRAAYLVIGIAASTRTA